MILRSKDFKGGQRSGESARSENLASESNEIAPVDRLSGQSVGIPSGPDAVELALADALTKAATAGRWDVVARLAAELETRRKARLEVVDLGAERAKRGRT